MPAFDHGALRDELAGNAASLSDNAIAPALVAAALGQGEGVLTAEALPVHRGRTQQIWTVTITDAADRLIARGQVRLQNIEDTGRIGAS